MKKPTAGRFDDAVGAWAIVDDQRTVNGSCDAPGRVPLAPGNRIHRLPSPERAPPQAGSGFAMLDADGGRQIPRPIGRPTQAE